MGAQYDAAGNQLTAWSDGLAARSAKYAYDGENRMTKADVVLTPSDSRTTTHAYDGDGRRVTRSSGGVVKTVWVYDAMGSLMAEYGGSAAGSGGTQYLVVDHLGSTRLVLNGQGDCVQRMDYLPFGMEMPRLEPGYGGDPPVNVSGVTQQFTGKERDQETANSANPSGLDYFGARYLSSAQGRFTSPDSPLLDQSPGDPQSWNLYGYVRNNPLVFTDPSGDACVVGPSGDYDDGGPGQKCSEAKKPQEFTFDGSTNVMTSSADSGGLSTSGQLFSNQIAVRRDASNQMIAFVGGGSAALGVAGGAATATGTVAAVIDGVAYTYEQIAVLGPEALARLVAAGKLSAEVVQRLAAEAPQLGNQVYLRLFAQSNSTTIPQGWLNNNNYLRIGEGFAPGGPVFRIAIGSKHVPLPSWVPGLVKGTLHLNLWRR